MATPRIFVSSTCYDLQEIRFQLRNFINDFGYDAVMSEFDDIFYSYDKHVQDSCLDEIGKCQLFVLVIGNNYGSFYHQDKQEVKIPDSVTLSEFRRALETKIPKHIFINKYVEYDYKNYKRALDKETLIYFEENSVSDEKTFEVKAQIKKDFDKTFFFPYESYKYVFYFLEIVNELKENNAVNSFETFLDVKDSLRKQWAGFMYESLTRKEKNVSSVIQPLEAKIDKIEKSILKLIESKTSDNGDTLSFNLATLSRDNNLESLETLQNKINQLLFDIIKFDFWTDEGENHFGQKVFFDKPFTSDSAKLWLESLKTLTQSFKWSKSIHCEKVFNGFHLSKYNRFNYEINYKTLFELYTIYNSLNEKDKVRFTNTVAQELNKSYEKLTKPKIDSLNDDLPF
ncbi:DUF4062 domain-containing protein [Aquirufa antheringensis]|uniref:DUF4062 domain-containing protein n=1 Tax=Aquirufa antheringensis TaxID=2516559 RepID=UPI0022A8B31E|nr:DUF4062 domain-containing protein [Aquirufa antheringensis]MCZ2486939.1 DUF4062 domain-containing protein [Aquirufa antheringensis]